MMLVSRIAQPEDAYLIDIRPADLDEISRYGLKVSPQDALANCIRTASQAFTALDKGGIVAIGGHSYSRSGVHPWVICAPSVERHKFTMVRRARAYLRHLSDMTGMLVWNHTPRKGPREEAFLHRLGFRVKHQGDQSVFLLEGP